MEGLGPIGKLLIFFGLIISATGIIILLAGKIPWIGRLPGDLYIQRRNFAFYFPITTSIIVSIILTLIIWFISKR